MGLRRSILTIRPAPGFREERSDRSAEDHGCLNLVPADADTVFILFLRHSRNLLTSTPESFRADGPIASAEDRTSPRFSKVRALENPFQNESNAPFADTLTAAHEDFGTVEGKHSRRLHGVPNRHRGARREPVRHERGRSPRKRAEEGAVSHPARAVGPFPLFLAAESWAMPYMDDVSAAPGRWPASLAAATPFILQAAPEPAPRPG